MAIKYTIIGLLVYATMLIWLLGAAAYLARNARWGNVLFAGGTVILAGAWVFRWVEVGHAPLQNMFEIMLTLAMTMYPLWLFCSRYLGARGPAANVIIALVLLVPVGFVFPAEPQHLPPALRSWLFVPHVAVYMISYAILILACVQAGLQLFARRDASGRLDVSAEQSAHRIVLLGLPLLTLGLVLGSWWAKIVWTDFWAWDPKELWSLASFLVFVGYLHLRSLYGAKYPRVNSILILIGGVCVILTMIWVNLDRIFKGAHSYAS